MSDLFELPAPPGDGWHTLFDANDSRPAVRVRLRPITPSALAAAQAMLGAANHPVDAYAADAGFEAFSAELIRRCLVEWEGVGRDGATLPVTADNVAAMLAVPAAFARLQALFVYPFLAREAEKNASSPSSAGTSPAKTGAKDTAAAAPAPATSAPTPSTRRARPKAK